MDGKTRWTHRLHIYILEIYVLSWIYFRNLYRNTLILETLLLFYIGFALLLAFAYFQLADTLDAASVRINALTLIRLSITVNTMPVFVTVFQRARKEEIAGLGKNGLVFEPVSVYYAKFIALNSFRILFFIPFTAIVYPIIGLRSGFNRGIIFFLILAVQQMAAISIGLLISAMFIDPIVAGVVISAIVLVTFLFSGSVMPRYAFPKGLAWLEYVSISFYAHQALIHNEFNGVTFGKLSAISYLQSQELDVLDIWPSIGALLLYCLICNTVGPIALSVTSRKSMRRYLQKSR